MAVWTFIGLLIAVFVAIFAVVLIVEIRTTLDKTNESLEEIKQLLHEMRKD